MNKELKTIVNKIKTVAKNNDVLPDKVTKTMLLSDSDVTEWELRKFGGLSSIIKANFPIEDKNLGAIRDIKAQSKYINDLERKLGEKQSFEDRLMDIVRNNPPTVPKLKQYKPQAKTIKQKREVVAVLNDTHVGAIIDQEELNGLNGFDFKEAGRRFAYFAKEVADYKIRHRHEVTRLHLVLNGDLTAGIIHGLETKGIHLLVHQQNALLQILTHAIAFLSQSYKEVIVHGIPGNHSRGVHKNHGKRAVSEVYDSYENMVYYGLSVAFRKSPQIKFNFPKTPYGFIDLPGGRAMYAHGDHVFSSALGNPGKTINVKALSSAIKDFNAGEIAQKREPIKLLILGHVHVFAHFITDDGVEVYIAPSLSGIDGFAHSLTINTNFVAQVVFESTKDFILGDSRLVRVDVADEDEELDKIIPTYNKELKWTE